MKTYIGFPSASTDPALRKSTRACNMIGNLVGIGVEILLLSTLGWVQEQAS